MTYEFKPGERVELHPATDMWMRGARYGTVTKFAAYSGTLGRDGIRGHRVRVKLDAWPRPLWIAAELVNCV